MIDYVILPLVEMALGGILVYSWQEESLPEDRSHLRQLIYHPEKGYIETMIELSNPRTQETIESWPSGKKRVTAYFELETNKKGTRCNRTTTGKPKSSTYHVKMAIVDGSDSKIYLLGLTRFDQIVLLEATLNGQTYFNPQDPEYSSYREVLDGMEV